MAFFLMVRKEVLQIPLTKRISSMDAVSVFVSTAMPA
jgi:hypothetical protein